MPRVRRGAGGPRGNRRFLGVLFLVDAQLPSALARWLAERDHVAEHVADIGLLSARDSEIWRYAIEHDAALIRRDEDFPGRVLLGNQGAGRRLGPGGNTTRAALLDWFDPLLEKVIAMIDGGERLIELR